MADIHVIGISFTSNALNSKRLRNPSIPWLTLRIPCLHLQPPATRNQAAHRFCSSLKLNPERSQWSQVSNYRSTNTHFHWSIINDKATGLVSSTWESQLASVVVIDRRPLLYFETRESRQSNRDSLNTQLPNNKPFTIWHSHTFSLFLHLFCVLCLLKTTLPIWLKFSCYAFQKAKFHLIFILLFHSTSHSRAILQALLDKTSESLSLGCFCNLKPKKATEIHCYDLSIEIYQNALFIQI